MSELRLGPSWYRPRSQPGHLRHEVLLRQRPVWPVSGQHQAVRSRRPGLAGVLWGQHWAWFEVLRALEVLQAPGRLARWAARARLSHRSPLSLWSRGEKAKQPSSGVQEPHLQRTELLSQPVGSENLAGQTFETHSGRSRNCDTWHPSGNLLSVGERTDRHLRKPAPGGGRGTRGPWYPQRGGGQPVVWCPGRWS